MREATPEDLARRFGEPYTASDLSAYLGWLEKKNLLQRDRDNPLTYRVSGLGLIAIGVLPREAWRVFVSVPSQKCFRFQTGVGPDKFTGISANNLSDLSDKVKIVDIKSLEFHLYRGDLEKWVKEALGDDELAGKISWIKGQNFRGDELRNKLLELIELRIRELTSIKA